MCPQQFRNILCPQQMFPSLRSMETQHSVCVPRVCAPKKHHEQQCVHNKVSSFASTLRPWQKRTHCCGHIVADTNVSPFARARNICCGHTFCVRAQKTFLILFRNILCPQQMFPSLRSTRNIMSKNVSATMCRRLPVP